MPSSDQNTKLVSWTLLALAACGPGAGTMAGPEPLTYARDVQPIVEKSCTGCHREGGIAPFALTSYAAVKAQRFAIEKVTHDRTMPPVLAAKGCADYANDATLSAGELLKTLGDAGFTARVETVNSLDAYLGSLPGHGYPNLRRPLLTRASTSNSRRRTRRPEHAGSGGTVRQGGRAEPPCLHQLARTRAHGRHPSHGC